MARTPRRQVYMLRDFQRNYDIVLGEIKKIKDTGRVEDGSVETLVHHLDKHIMLYENSKGRFPDHVPNYPHISWKDFNLMKKHLESIRYVNPLFEDEDPLIKKAEDQGRKFLKHYGGRPVTVHKERELLALFNELLRPITTRENLRKFFNKTKEIGSIHKTLLDQMHEGILAKYPTRKMYLDIIRGF